MTSMHAQILSIINSEGSVSRDKNEIFWRQKMTPSYDACRAQLLASVQSLKCTERWKEGTDSIEPSSDLHIGSMHSCVCAHAHTCSQTPQL